MIRHVLGLWLVVVLVLSAPVQAAGIFNPQTTTLANGLQVVVLPNHRAPVVTQMIVIKAGAMDDPWGKSGIAHFLEHLMFKGTQAYPGDTYSRVISRLGGEQNAFTSNDYTAYYATVGRDSLEKIMAMEADRLGRWVVSEDDVTVERSVILKERQQRTENNPVARFHEQVETALYPNHPYQRPTIGWRNEMETLSRADAMAFFEKYYAPNNAILILSGDVTLETVLPMVEKHFGTIAPRPVPSAPDLQVPKITSARTVTKKDPHIQQTQWSRYVLVPSVRVGGITNSLARDVLMKILGDAQTGRLYRRLAISEKRATHVTASCDDMRPGPGLCSFYVLPTADKPVEKIDAIIKDTLRQLAEKPLSEVTVKEAVQAISIPFIYSRDSLMEPALIVASALVSGVSLEVIEAYEKHLQAVTPAAVQAEAQKMLALYDSGVEAILLPGETP